MACVTSCFSSMVCMVSPVDCVLRNGCLAGVGDAGWVLSRACGHPPGPTVPATEACTRREALLGFEDAGGAGAPGELCFGEKADLFQRFSDCLVVGIRHAVGLFRGRRLRRERVEAG